MPAIRDTSAAYETVTTDAGITIPMCAYGLNDLLLVFVTGDTGAPTWGCSNGVGTWTQLYAQNNTCSSACYWKYAAASGEGDIVVTSTVNETYNGVVVAVRDVYQGYTGGSPPVESHAAQASSTRFTMPTITTSAADSLCLLATHSSALVSGVHFVEGEAHELVVQDGAAEGSGIGWFWKKAAGLTSSTVYCDVVTAGAGVKATVEVRAPAGGATVIPPYVASDASIYLDHGAFVVFDGNAIMANTADTNFGTSIAGKTCNDATASKQADIGINSYHSFTGVANTAVAGQMSGANMGMAAARYNVGTRNILCHFRHPLPAHNQRLSTLGSGRGVWMGMRSGATAGANWAVWQVHGSDVALPAGYIQPLIVSASNTDTIATNGTLDSADVRFYGFWNGGAGVLQNTASFGPLWAMDTLVMAGGVAAEPIDIPGIVATAAVAKERMSSLLQGSNQMLCLQSIQFGDGGTNSVYLKIAGGAVEFPGRKDSTKKRVNYNGVDDSVGWTFYPGATDTIDLNGTGFASANKFHWRIHASASASATYDFTGVVVNGAGDVQLRNVTTFTGMSFTNCPTITQNSAAIASTVFKSSTITSATLGDMDNITDCAFTSSGTGHAVEVGGTAGTVSLDGLTFTGYAATNGSTGNEAIYVNIASGTVTLNITGGGSTPSIRTAGATVVVQNAVTVTVTVKDASTLAAIENARVLVEKTSDGTDILSGVTNASGVVTGSYAYAGDTPVTGNVRRATVALGTLYKPNVVAGTITASGLDVTILLTSDE
jgi:hypothetical protein